MALRLDLETNPDFLADLLDDSLTRDMLTEKWNASAGFISDRRRKARAGKSIRSVDIDGLAAEMPPSEESEIHDPEKGSSFTRMSATPWGKTEWDIFIEAKGMNPEEVTYTWGVTSNPAGGYWNKLLNVRAKAAGADGIPAWPVIQPSRNTYVIQPPAPRRVDSGWKTAVVAADTQIGFDMDEEGNLIPFHDNAAIDVFLQILEIEKPDQAILAGDILDLAEQGRWVQEARFARTTQAALDYSRHLAAEMRARTSGEIIWIEGNHDKRMQGFMEVNAKASMGLRRAGYPDSWPVMSIPHLVGLDDFAITYVDAYPAGVHWITDDLRAIHGTRANSKGNTMSQYANETPHISTIAGHTHRLEIQSKTTFDRAGKIRTMNINPGCLCRVDGMVPSVHGARHLDGSKATYWEDWQQGVAIIRYKDSGEFFVDLVQIDEGRTVYQGQEIQAR